MQRFFLPLPILISLFLICACSLFGRLPAEPSVAAPSPSLPPATTLLEPAASETPAGPARVEVTVYFTDSRRYATGAPPFEAGVTRQVDPAPGLPAAVLMEFFHGPTEQERAQGLERIDSGFTGFSDLRIADGVARVYLAGSCRSNGATYTIAAPLLANLTQFEEIQYVKIYDAEGSTEQPDGPANSIPFCLEP